MAEYIDREAVLDCFACDLGKKDYSVSYQGFMTEVAFRINDLPAADVRPVKRGKWEEVEVSYVEDMYDKGNLPEAIVSMYCPICARYHNEVYWYGNPTEHISFCPHCGSDMRGEIVEDTTSGCGRCDKCRINDTGRCR